MRLSVAGKVFQGHGQGDSVSRPGCPVLWPLCRNLALGFYHPGRLEGSFLYPLMELLQIKLGPPGTLSLDIQKVFLVGQGHLKSSNRARLSWQFPEVILQRQKEPKMNRERKSLAHRTHLHEHTRIPVNIHTNTNELPGVPDPSMYAIL